MNDLIIACVLTGRTKYSMIHVERLHSGVTKHLKQAFRFICLTDWNFPKRNDLHFIDGVKFPKWWGKINLFDRMFDNGHSRVLYFDLDTVIVGDLSPLANLDVPFGICANFTRAAGHPNWPCKYGSCVMTLGPGFGCTEIWEPFVNRQAEIMRRCSLYGDQKAIEELYPNAALLQHLLPINFFLGYRDLDKLIQGPSSYKPLNTAAVIFAGSHTPEKCTIPWVIDEL